MTKPADTFLEATRRPGRPDREPYAYQERTADTLLAGRDVLLTAPTGAGKTLAVLLPFLHARRTGQAFADRVLYALPLRALAHRLAADTREQLRPAFPDLTVTVQTGAQPDDELLSGDIIFTTIDQLLSAYLMLPLSLPRRLDNINAGALVGSLVVFDEAHLLEPGVALSTLAHLRRTLHDQSRLVLATATLGTQAREMLSRELGLTEVTPAVEEMARIPALAHRRRTWCRADEQLTAGAVRERHRGERTLVVLNSVRRAQEVARDLFDDPPAGAEVIVLHSRFLPDDRALAEGALAGRLGPDAPKANVIVVATQVVEAGIDCSAEILLTELAPANALVQRAGRCGRYEPPRNEGDVVVFDADRSRGPYVAWREPVDRCWSLLPTEPTVWSPADEAQLVDQSLGDREAATFADEVFSQSARRMTDDEVLRAWSNGDLRALADRVRNIRSATVFLSANPANQVVPADRPVGLSVPWIVWAGFLRRDGTDGIVGVAADDADPEERPDPGWRWSPVSGPDDARIAYAVSPARARYSRLGLELGVPSEESPPPVLHRGAKPWTRYRYRAETYSDHVRRTLFAAGNALARLDAGLRALATRHGLDPDNVRLTALLAAGLHDVGKLSRRCQEAVREHQGRRGRPVTEPLAHTDHDPATDPVSRSPFGPHALEGAVAVADWVGRTLLAKGIPQEGVGALTLAVASAIARHHAPRGEKAGRFSLVADAEPLVVRSLSEALNLPPGEGSLLAVAEEMDLSGWLIDPRCGEVDHRAALPLYWFLVRLVRLADQEATAEGAAAAPAECP